MKVDIEFDEVVSYIFSKVASYNEDIFLVGGSVRDHFLKRESNDYDFCTSCSVSKLKLIFKDEKFFNKNRRWGTLSFIKDEKEIEITSFNGSSIEEDLRRRDFTVDSIAVDKDKNLYTVEDTLKDLEDRVLRFNSPMDEIIKDDPLRLLRAVRLASTLNLTIDSESKKAILDNYELINKVSKERIAKEFTLFIVNKDSARYIDEYYLLFSELIDELKDMDGFMQNNRYHAYDVKDHTLKVLESIEKRTPILCISALFHDLGKPAVYFLDENGNGHFHGHALVSADLATRYLNEFCFPKRDIEKIVKLVHYHDYPVDTKRQVKKLMGKIGEDLIEDMFVLKRADIMGQNPAPEYMARLDTFVDKERWVKEIIEKNECFSLKNLAINGNDLKNLSKFEGEEIGIILNTLLKLVVEEKLNNNKEELLDYVRTNYLN